MVFHLAFDKFWKASNDSNSIDPPINLKNHYNIFGMIKQIHFKFKWFLHIWNGVWIFW
jgi:hypothetical protein